MVADRFFSSQEELYARCAALAGQEDPQRAKGSFHAGSPPYLMATEHPWIHLSPLPLAGASVLTVAGSGDAPLFFCRKEARIIRAVDVSRSACYLNELKRTALARLDRKAFAAFFLAGIPRAEPFLRRKGMPLRLAARERVCLYKSLRDGLSPSAALHWDACLLAEPPGPSPFRSSLGTLDLLGLDQIPYLNSAEAYERWRRHARPYPLLSLPLEAALESFREELDLIYASNILEYQKRDHLLAGTLREYEGCLNRLSDRTAKALKPGGRIYFYLFEARTSTTFQEAEADLAPFRARGLEAVFHDVRYRTDTPVKSRFRNTLVELRKPGSTGGNC